MLSPIVTIFHSVHQFCQLLRAVTRRLRVTGLGLGLELGLGLGLELGLALVLKKCAKVGRIDTAIFH